MRQKVRLGVATFIASALVAACGSSGTTTERSITYGTATITPAVVKVGTSFTLTPTKVIQPFCGWSADLYRAVDGMPKVLQLNPDGHFFLYGGPGSEPTVLACGSPPNGKPMKYLTTPDLPVGTWVMCVTYEPTSDGCATFRTVKG
jgi:hypothetical protein